MCGGGGGGGGNAGHSLTGCELADMGLAVCVPASNHLWATRFLASAAVPCLTVFDKLAQPAVYTLSFG